MVQKHGTGGSLSRKLLLLGALPLVAMFLVLMAFFTSVRMDDARRDQSRSNQVLADSLAPALEYAMVSGNIPAVDQLLSRSLKYSQAAWMQVSDIQGQPVSFVSARGVETPIQPGQYDIYEAEILQQSISMDTGKYGEWFDPEPGSSPGTAFSLGKVQVGVSTGLPAERRQDILWTTLTIGTTFLIFTILLVWHYINSILEPIRRISGRIGKLIGRDYSTELVGTAHGSREFLDLEQQLNELALRLDSLRTARDQILSDSEQAREKAEAASSSKSDFLATMSHELRTPLNTVLGMIDQIEDEPLSDTQKSSLNTARQATDDFLTVISDILDYSRLDNSHMTLESRSFDLRKLITNCTATYRHVAQQQKLELNLNFYGYWPETSLVTGDAGRLRQVLAGLIDNAIKYTADGFIEIHAERIPLEDNVIALNCSISDSGSGIPMEHLQDIFNSFEQVDSGDSRAFGGTGLGLALVQRLVEIMGGHIQVESDLGKGSSFRFELPFELDTDASARQSTPAATPATGRNATRALVIEDNPVNQRVTTTMLARLGFQPDTASDGKEALALVTGNPYQYAIILMDCQMPVMDGYETTRRIRQWEQDQNLPAAPVIALTADVSSATEKSCLSSGMNGYLTKPVRKDSLQDVLNRWTASKESPGAG